MTYLIQNIDMGKVAYNDILVNRHVGKCLGVI